MQTCDILSYSELDVCIRYGFKCLEDTITHPILSLYTYPHYNSICNFLKDSRGDLNKANIVRKLFYESIKKGFNPFYTSEWLLLIER